MISIAWARRRARLRRLPRDDELFWLLLLLALAAALAALILALLPCEMQYASVVTETIKNQSVVTTTRKNSTSVFNETLNVTQNITTKYNTTLNITRNVTETTIVESNGTAAIDLIFVYDRSDSMGAGELQIEFNFMQTMVEHFNASSKPGDFAVGAIGFGEIVETDFNLTTDTEFAYNFFTNASKFTTHATAQHLALQRYQEMSLSWGRPNVTSLLVFISDGESKYKTASFEDWPGNVNPNTGLAYLNKNCFPETLIEAQRIKSWNHTVLSIFVNENADDASEARAKQEMYWFSSCVKNDCMWGSAEECDNIAAADDDWSDRYECDDFQLDSKYCANDGTQWQIARDPVRSNYAYCCTDACGQSSDTPTCDREYMPGYPNGAADDASVVENMCNLYFDGTFDELTAAAPGLARDLLNTVEKSKSSTTSAVTSAEAATVTGTATSTVRSTATVQEQIATTTTSVNTSVALVYNKSSVVDTTATYVFGNEWLSARGSYSWFRRPSPCVRHVISTGASSAPSGSRHCCSSCHCCSTCCCAAVSCPSSRRSRRRSKISLRSARSASRASRARRCAPTRCSRTRCARRVIARAPFVVVFPPRLPGG